VIGLAFLLPVAPNDFWWYVRIGRDTLASGAIPEVDTLSSTQASSPVVYHSWLASIILWLSYKTGGISLVVLLRGFLVGAAYTLLWLFARRMGAGVRLASILALVAALTGSNNWAVRPQLFTYVLFLLILWVLWDWHGGKKKSLWILPILSLLWVNTHGSFVLVFLLGGVSLIFGRGDRRALAIALGAGMVFTLINPRGWQAWTYVLDMLSAPSNQLFSIEWLAPINNNWQMNLFFLWMLLFPLAVALSSRRLDRFEWALFLVFGFLAFSGLRYVIWEIFILVILSAALLAEFGNRWLDKPDRKSIPAMNISLSVLFLLLSFIFFPSVRFALWKDTAPAIYSNTPIEATQWLTSHPELPGPLWADLAFSSYLVYALPERPVWIDTRFEVYPVEHWQKFKAIDSARWDWQILLDEAGANLLMISRASQPELLGALEKSATWCDVYQDEQAVIFTRCDGQ
jgi:hypothetical protein